jgi:hypothetical protein
MMTMRDGSRAQKLYRALWDFVPQEDGDLELTAGAMVVGTLCAGQGFWSGYLMTGARHPLLEYPLPRGPHCLYCAQAMARRSDAQNWPLSA